MTAFVLTRVPIVVAAIACMWAAARQWRSDRVVATLLFSAALLLLASQASACPVRVATSWGGDHETTLARWFDLNRRSARDAPWLDLSLLAAAGACGLAAVFLRKEGRT
ncbi:hypothetical protein [Alienimonas chondri]|nr:hypothetical protein [Alienimonas chondri]